MKNFVANVKLVFQDAFTSGAAAAKSGIKGIGEAMEGLKSDGGLLRTASDIGLLAATTEQYRQKLVSALAVPSTEAAKLESSLAATTTVMTADNTIDGDIGRTYEALRQQALDWATGTAQGSRIATASAADYAATTYSMLSAGLKYDAAIAATNTSLVLAKGTMGDSRAAADLLAIAYNTMGDKSADADAEMTRLADTVAKTQAAFQIANLGQLNDGLKYGIPVAQKYGIAWDELSTIIGQLNTSGLTGSLAGTSLSSMMAQLNKASGKLGFSIAYNEDGGTDVIGTLGNIQAKFGDVTKLTPKVQMAFDEAFGVEGGRALTLLSASLDGLKANYTQIADAEGQAELMASRMASTYADKQALVANARAATQSQLGQSTNRIKGLALDVQLAWYKAESAILSTPIGGKLSYLVSGGAMAASGLMRVGGVALNTTAQIATIVAMSSKVGGFFGLLKSSVRLCSAPLVGLGRMLGMAGKGVLSVGKAAIGMVPRMGAWIASAWSAAAAHWAMLGPILLVVAAVAALAAGAYLVVRHWEPIKAFFVGLWDGLVAGARTALDWLVAKVTAVVDAIKKPFVWIKDKVGGLFGKKEGAAVVDTMAEGVSSEGGALASTTADVFTDTAAYLPHSDADRGPFSALTKSGMAIPRTMAQGVTVAGPDLAASTADVFGSVDTGIMTGKIIQFPQQVAVQVNPVPAPALDAQTLDMEVRRITDLPSVNLDRGMSDYGNDGGDIMSLLRMVKKLLSSKDRRPTERHYHTSIANITLPDVTDLDGVVRFVRSLQDELDREDLMEAVDE